MLAIPLFPENASTIGGEIDAIYIATFLMSVFFTVLIFGAVLYLMVKYRRQHENEIGDPVHGSLLLEITWSVIPFIIVMVLFFWGAKVFWDARQPPESAREYLVTGKQWMWKMQHPEGHREINTLHIPVGQKIKLTMTSEDVIHSFFIPEFRLKQDVIPGRYSTMWFEATKPGEYKLFCAEYCGSEHSQMIGSVIAMESEEYQTWLAGGIVGSPPVAAGAELFQQYGCATCHGAENDSLRGPSLVGIAGKSVTLQGGLTKVRDDNYLRESIVRPAAKLVANYPNVMPTYQGQISEEGIAHLIAYIKDLKPPGQAAPAQPAGH